MKLKYLYSAIILVVSFLLFYSPYREYKEGIFIDEEPHQINIDSHSFQHEGYLIETKADYSLTAKILRKEKYYFDRASDISSIDLALGWKLMSDEQYLKKIDITQKGRFYYWNTEHYPIKREEIISQSANTHIIYGNSAVKNIIEDVDAGEFIYMQGYLVDVVKVGERGKWRTSLTRNDSGAGACEVFFVEFAEKRDL